MGVELKVAVSDRLLLLGQRLVCCLAVLGLVGAMSPRSTISALEALGCIVTLHTKATTCYIPGRTLCDSLGPPSMVRSITTPTGSFLSGGQCN